MRAFPVNIQSDYLTQRKCEPHRSYVQSRTGNYALWHIFMRETQQSYAASLFISGHRLHSAARKVREVPRSTHAFLILPLDAASGLGNNGRNKKQWGRMFCREGERIVPRFLESRSRDHRGPAGMSEREEQHPHKASEDQRFPAGR